MADFITTKANGDSLDASEWNQLEEIDNAIDSSGLTLTTAQKDQLKISMARYASGANFYTDGGSANAYVLTSISHGGGKSFAPAGAGAVNYFNGMNVRFRPANNNSGASTVNVSSFGLKDIRKSDGTTALTGGELTTANDVILRYDSTNSCFIIQEYLPATSTVQGVVYLSNPITISNNATDANNDIDFSAGNFILNNGFGQGLLATALTKRLDASWVAGTNQGGLLSGTKAINSTYHWFAIQKPDGTVDIGAILGVAGTTPDPTSVLPSGYTTFSKNPIVSVITDGSGNIINAKYKYKLDGNYICKYNTAITEFFRTNTVVSSLQAISIPAGIQTQAYSSLVADISSISTGTYSSATAQDFNKTTITSFAVAVVKIPSLTNTVYSKPAPILSNTSKQIWFASEGSTNLSSVGLYTDGFETIY